MIRADLASSLSEMGFVPRDAVRTAIDAPRTVETWDANAANTTLLKSIISASLWPSVIRVVPPGVKYDQGISGTIQRDHEAKAVKFFDAYGDLGRVFIHPGSTLFSVGDIKSRYLTAFSKAATGGNDKVYLRDANEAPLLGLLLLAPGKVVFDHNRGGLEIKAISHDSRERSTVRLQADARVGVLSNQMRRLLNAVLDDAIEEPRRLLSANSRQILRAVSELLE